MSLDKNNKDTNKTSLRELSIASIVFSGKVRFKKLAKITLIFSAAPALIIFIFMLNGFIGQLQGVFLFGAIFLVSLMFYYPYIADLQEVTDYVNDLAKDLNPQQPSLSYINDVDELSDAILKLNNSWQNKNNALKILLQEDEILINSLPTIILMLDKDFNVLQVNQAAENIFGWNYMKVINEIISDQVIVNFCKQTAQTGEGADLRYEYTNSSHYFFNIRAEKFPINSPNNISLVLILQNITQERKTEKMLTDFVANASHEIKTPLASISGFIETLSEQQVNHETQNQFLKVMKEQADRMSRLVNDLLTLSVIESGVGRKNFELLNLNDVLTDAILNLHKSIKVKEINLITHLEADLPKILGNRDDLVRVIDNLINNAIKYSKEKSDIIVRIFSTENSFQKITKFSTDSHLVCLSVQDFGEGIDEKYLPRLTERFFRIDKARSRSFGGTGLGLSIVKNIIENHDGYLQIKSKLGEGSTFAVYFPVTIVNFSKL